MSGNLLIARTYLLLYNNNLKRNKIYWGVRTFFQYGTRHSENLFKELNDGAGFRSFTRMIQWCWNFNSKCPHVSEKIQNTEGLFSPMLQLSQISSLYSTHSHWVLCKSSIKKTFLLAPHFLLSSLTYLLKTRTTQDLTVHHIIKKYIKYERPSGPQHLALNIWLQTYPDLFVFDPQCKTTNTGHLFKIFMNIFATTF